MFCLINDDNKRVVCSKEKKYIIEYKKKHVPKKFKHWKIKKVKK